MLSKDFIEEYMSKFRASHKGLKDLKIKVFSSMEDAFPLVPKKERDEKALAGAYYPASNIVLIIAENNKNIQQLHATIRHEIFGHLAINRLNEVDKYDLLQTIADASSDTWVGKYRDYLAMTSYKVLKDEPLMLAEEVVAHTAELSFNDIGRYESIPDPTMVESKEDLLGVIDALKNGMHHGVLEQKVFPAGDLAQFKVQHQSVEFKENFEEYLHFSIEGELERTGEISKATKERIIAYGSLMDDKALIEAVESEDKEDLAALGDYFQELSQNEYLDYESFDSNQLQEMR